MRRSSKVTLVLLGVATLAGCDSGEDRIRRDIYASKADCLADWGNQPEDCSAAGNGTSHFMGPYYVRPWYSGFGSWTGGHTSTHSIGSSSGSGGSSGSVSRGGFGSSSSARGAAGS